MTAPVPARDHANMTVAEREFTFDALLAEFGEPDAPVQVASGSVPVAVAAPAVVVSASPERRQAPDAAAVSPAPAKRSAAKSPTAKAPAVKAPAAPRPRAARRSFQRPSADVLKFGGLVAVAGVSLTLVFVALSR